MAVCESYVRPAIQCQSGAWCLKESEMGMLQRTERSIVRAMCEAHRQKKIYVFNVHDGFE